MNNLPAGKNRRILIIDDNPAIHADFRKILIPADTTTDLEESETALFGLPTILVRRSTYEIDSAYQGQDGVLLVQQALATEQPYAMAFVDIRMPPGIDGVETAQKIWAVDPEIQIVLCTAYADYSWDEMFEKIGDSDAWLILKKPFDSVEALQLAQALTEKWWLHRQSWRKLEELEGMVAGRTSELLRQQTELRVLFDLMPALIWFKDTQNRFLRVNQRAADAAGKSVAEMDGKPGIELYPEDAAKFYADDLEVINSRAPKLGIVETIQAANGQECWIQTDKVPVCDKEGKVVGIVVMAQDITERRRTDENARRLAAIVEGSEEAIIGKTLQGVITSWNPAAEKMFGYQASEIIGQPLQLLVPPDRSQEEVEILAGFTRGELVRHFETFRVRKNGEKFEVSVSISPIKDGDGKVVGVAKIVRDITERRRTEESLRLLSSAVAHAKESIVITDAELNLPGPRIVFVNPAYTKMTGYTSAEALGKNPRILQGPRTDKAILRRLRKNLERGEVFAGETINYRKDGTEFELEWQVAPICNADGKTTHFVAIQRDMTERNRERKRIEAQLIQAQKLESVGQLAAGIAHEINTPTQYVGDNTRFVKDSFESISKVLACHQELLAATRQNIVTPELLARQEAILAASDLDYLREQIPSALKETLEGVERVSKIVRAMKEFSHPGGKEKTVADLNRAIESTVTVARNEWKYVADLDLDLEPGLPFVPCFVGEFNQAILNLVVNAAHTIGDVVKKNPGSKGRITIRSRSDGDHVEIRVSDTGMGIPEANRRKIFEPFFTTKEVGKGTGQGLSIVYGSIVKRHGGTATFETEIGQGTTFILRLPVNPKSPPEANQPAALERHAA